MLYPDGPRWLPMIRVPRNTLTKLPPENLKLYFQKTLTKLPPKNSDEAPPKKLEIVFSENLRDEMARHLNVAAAADNLFLFCIFDRFGFFIFVKAAAATEC